MLRLLVLLITATYKNFRGNKIRLMITENQIASLYQRTSAWDPRELLRWMDGGKHLETQAQPSALCLITVCHTGLAH